MEIKIDEAVRQQALSIFERLHITEEEAILLFYKRTIACNRMPFSDQQPRKEKRKKTRMNERFAEWDAF